MNPSSASADSAVQRGMFFPEREDVCINDDSDEDHVSLNSIPELVEDTDEEDDTVNQGTCTSSTPYVLIDGSGAHCHVPGRVILSGDSGVHFGREERLTSFRVLTHCELSRFMFHMDYLPAHDRTRPYFIPLPSRISHDANRYDSCVGAPQSDCNGGG